MAKTTQKSDVSALVKLQGELVTKRNELLDAKKGHANGELANPHYLTKLRKEIARIMTNINKEQSNKEDK